MRLGACSTEKPDYLIIFTGRKTKGLKTQKNEPEQEE